MTLIRKSITTLIWAFSITACATMDDLTEPPAQPKAGATTPGVTQGIERYMDQRAHVESVGFRLRKAANTECTRLGKSRADLGIVVWSLANFPNSEDQNRLRAAFELTNAVTVAIAVEGGPARTAGLSAGDIIRRVNGDTIPSGTGATERFISLSNLAARRGPVTLDMESGRSLRVDPVNVCEYPALLVRSPETNAAADGASIAITTALYELTRSDDELALVLGHELAHNILGHLDASRATTSKSGRLLDAFTRSSISAALSSATTPAYDPAKEIEADRVGLQLMARAGFDTSAADAVWTRLNNTGAATLLSRTHPTGKARQAALRQAVQEIRASKPR
jgi:hypothetical protein